MKTEEEIRALIEHYKDLLSDHHLLLNKPIIRNTIELAYGAIISTLTWVLDEKE